MLRLECGVSPLPVARRSGLSPAGFVLRGDDHCVSFRVFASSRETNGVVCPRLRPISGRFVP
ncbi:MAG: hypothetical protein ACK6EB_40735, partial [Planctomyces sp.]